MLNRLKRYVLSFVEPMEEWERTGEEGRGVERMGEDGEGRGRAAYTVPQELVMGYHVEKAHHFLS